MNPERNAPCPCGSGKKYKKCCGLIEAPKPDPINENRAIAYSSEFGRARRAFCEEYTLQKKAVLKVIEDGLRQDLSNRNMAISCGKGCTQCCQLFVVASLQECEAIVFYLYNNEGILNSFLKSFDFWKERIFRIERCFKRINDLHQRITAGTCSPEERKQFDIECDNYVRAGIMCPFITSGACSIYEVRPYVCAGVVSVTPRDWCAPQHTQHSEASFFKSTFKSSCDMPYFALPKSGGIFASMPSLVYDILRRGYAALSLIPGIQGLQSELYSVPDVTPILGKDQTAFRGQQ